MNRHPLCLPMKHLVLAAACGLGAIAATPVAAQIAPNATEVAAYKGLHAAAHRGDVAQIEKLAAAKSDMKAELDARDGNGRTPLHVATFAKQQGAIRALVKAGANLQLADRQGNRPLQLAKSRGYGEMVQMLEKAGAR